MHWIKFGRSVEELSELVHCRGHLVVHTRCYAFSKGTTLEFLVESDRDFFNALMTTICRGHDNY